jgi:hypothetical protein
VLTACGFHTIRVFGEPLIVCDLRSWVRKTAFSFIKPLVKALYIIGTGGGGQTSISHVIEPSIAAIGEKMSAENY